MSGMVLLFFLGLGTREVTTTTTGATTTVTATSTSTTTLGLYETYRAVTEEFRRKHPGEPITTEKLKDMLERAKQLPPGRVHELDQHPRGRGLEPEMP